MKKIALLFLPLLLLASCQKDEVTLNAVIQTFGDGKVHLTADDYAVFDDGDLVRINGANYPVTVAADGSASVSGVESSTEYTSIFPARSDDKVVLPQEQSYEEVEVNGVRVQKINAPMAAKDERVLHYKNLCSLLEVQVTAPVADFDVLSISVTSSNTSTYLYGTYNVSWSNTGVPSLSGLSSNGRGHTVTLNCNRYRIATAGTTKTFYVVLPPFNSTALTVHVQGHSTTNSSGTTGTLFFHNTQQSESFRLPANMIVTGASIPDANDYTVIPGLQGVGTEWNPYKLYSYNDLYYAASVINAGEVDYITEREGQLFRTGYFRVMNDINCGYNVVIPLGSKNSNFEGTLDGRGEDNVNHTITYNKLADLGGDIGLIGIMTNESNVKNLTVTGDIQVARQYGNQVNVIGGVVGVIKCTDANKTSQIINCHNTANIHTTEQQSSSITLDNSKSAHVGGVLGSIWVESSGGKVEVVNCSNSGDIEGIVSTVLRSGTGGIVGSRVDSANLEIGGCVNSGKIVCNTKNQTAGAGGILGFLKEGTPRDEIKIVNCENQGVITNASATTDNSKVSIGGICGYWNNGSTNAFIANCVNHGNVVHLSTSANGYAGGIIGNLTVGGFRVKNCYSDGTVSGCTDSRRGGVLGKGGAATMEGCYYLPTTNTTWASGSSTNTAGNQIGDGLTSYSELLSTLNTWVGNNSTATPAYSSWIDVSGKPELSSLHSTTAGAKRRR